MSARLASIRVNAAFSLAADVVHYSRCYTEAARIARCSSGLDRCVWAGVASGYARKARKAAREHGRYLAFLRSGA